MSKRVPEPEIDRPLSLPRWLRLILALLVLVGLFSSAFPVVSLDQRLGDFYFRMRAAQPTSTAVALVLIDDEALARYGRWPWHRRDLARLVRTIASFQPKAIGIDILLLETEDKSNDGDLAQAIAGAHNVVLASKISGSLAGSLWVDPLPIFSKNAAAVGHVQAALDTDGVCRRIPIVEPSVEGSRFAFALKLAEIARPELMRMETGGAKMQESLSENWNVLFRGISRSTTGSSSRPVRPHLRSSRFLQATCWRVKKAHNSETKSSCWALARWR